MIEGDLALEKVFGRTVVRDREIHVRIIAADHYHRYVIARLAYSVINDWTNLSSLLLTPELGVKLRISVGRFLLCRWVRTSFVIRRNAAMMTMSKCVRERVCCVWCVCI